MDHDRRRHARYKRADLELDVARPGIKGILSLNLATECRDFCLAGLRFGSDQIFEIGETVILDLRVYEVAAHEIQAKVISCARDDDGSYCVGVRFCFEEKNMQRPEISHALLHIEDRLRMAEEFPMIHSVISEHQAH